MSPDKSLARHVAALALLAKVSETLRLARKTITTGALTNGGKLYPAHAHGFRSGIMDEEDKESTSKSIYVPIAKVNEELREVTGVVLQPEVTDAQGDIMDADVIAKAAGSFLANFNKNTKLGYMHNQFNKRFELRQSFIAPDNMVIANKTVKKGAWLMVVKVLDDKVWESVKKGKITGFSIGGKAKVKKLTE